MHQHSIIKLFIVSGLIGIAFACSKNDPAASSAPVIAFKSIRKVTLETNATKTKRDSVVVTIDFSDGNGDLGEDSRDSTRLKSVFGNQPWGNYQIRAFRLVNNVFEEVPQVSNTKLFIDLGNSSKGSVLPEIGTLDYSQLFPYNGTTKRLPFKFQIRMRDRNLNESNVVETDTLFLPSN